MKKVVFIISGGELGDPGFFREKSATAGALICADSGARYLKDAGITPDLIVGDMDSLDPETEGHYRDTGCRINRCLPQKDETDTELALREAFAMGATEVWIWGAMGNRIDHTLANIALMMQGAERGVEVKLVDSWCEVFLIARRTVVEGAPGQTVSLLPFGGEASGVTLTGFEYPLTKATLSVAHPLGISNRLVGSRGTIDVKTGCLLAVRYFQPDIFPGGKKE